MRAVALVALTAIAAMSVSVSSAATDPWKALYRPLEVPKLAPGEPCRVSAVDASVDFASFGIGPGVGRGPAYPVGLHLADGTLELSPPARFGSRSWGGQKVLWFVHPRYRGPVLVRGRQLDGSHRVRFDRGSVPPPALRIVPGETQVKGGRVGGGYARLRAPGCYGYQIDGASFSRVVVFRAEWID